MVYGKDNCEKVNSFTFTRKCPDNYLRVDHTRCMKDCSPYQDKIILNQKCYVHTVEYLNDLEAFGSLEECREKYEFCYEKSKDGEGSEWLRDCPLHKKKIGFMCVPECISEMSQQLFEQLTQDDRYCIQDFVRTGIPFYDFK